MSHESNIYDRSLFTKYPPANCLESTSKIHRARPNSLKNYPEKVKNFEFLRFLIVGKTQIFGDF